MFGITRKDVVLLICGAVLGIAGGWYTSAYFAGKQWNAALEEAKGEARVEGIAEGNAEAKAAFLLTERERLEEMFQATFEAIRSEARGAGYGNGFAEGREVGFANGFDEGVAASEARQREVLRAEENWNIYWENLRRLRSLVAAPEGLVLAPGGSEAFLGGASALISSANELRRSYEQQSSAFNSLVQDLERALEARNFQEMRRLVIALEGSAETKGGIFIDAVRAQDAIFSELESRISN